LGVEDAPGVAYARAVQRRTLGWVLAAAFAVLIGSGFAAGATYSGPATRAAAKADPHAHITAPSPSDVPVGKPTLRFAFRLTRNSGEVAVYRAPADAVKALARGEALAKAFGQTLKGLAAVHRNVIIGFDKRPTAAERAETQGWLR
jgi:hypothetical protein